VIKAYKISAILSIGSFNTQKNRLEFGIDF
jgi:hypothetical protein